jgi:hypothetical protein
MIEIENKVYGLMKANNFSGSLAIETVKEVLVESLGVLLISLNIFMKSSRKCSRKKKEKSTLSILKI